MDVGWDDFGGFDSEPAGLNIHHFEQRHVGFVHDDGGAGEAAKVGGSGYVVDVGVGDDYLLEFEVKLLEEGVDGGDVVAGVYDGGFARVLISEDGAVAGDGADAED